jgi:hypothetical protein
MKNPLFNMKSVIKGSYKATVLLEPAPVPEPKLFESRSWSGNFLKVGAGAETKSFGSTTLASGIHNSEVFPK